MSNLSSVIKVVSNLAPELGALLGGPAGGLIGAAIAHEFGGSISDPDTLAATIIANPNGAQILATQIQEQSAPRLVLSL